MAAVVCTRATGEARGAWRGHGGCAGDAASSGQPAREGRSREHAATAAGGKVRAAVRETVRGRGRPGPARGRRSMTGRVRRGVRAGVRGKEAEGLTGAHRGPGSGGRGG